MRKLVGRGSVVILLAGLLSCSSSQPVEQSSTEQRGKERGADGIDLAGELALDLRPRNALGAKALEEFTSDPTQKLAKIGFLRQNDYPRPDQAMVQVVFPNVPGLFCESLCYESGVEFSGVRKLQSGDLELRHRLPASPHVELVTTVTRTAGTVEFVVRPIVRENAAPDRAIPETLPDLNMCFQLGQSSVDWMRGYPEFAASCFIFTDRGRTFLSDTDRKTLSGYRHDHPRNNPPWVQNYAAVWQPIPDDSSENWAPFSTDRFTIPVIGVVSRDHQHLVAVANGSAGSVCNAWHFCVHNNPEWEPHDAPLIDRRWRLKVYAMMNDPDALLDRVAQDFPRAEKLKENRVPGEQ